MEQQTRYRGKALGRRVLAILAVLCAWVFTSSQEPVPANPEYAVKAAFVCQMIKFVTWPKDKPVDANNVITISILGPNRFGKMFEPAKDQVLKDKTLVIKEFTLLTPPPPDDAIQEVVWTAYLQALRTSHVAYIVGAPKEDLSPLLTALRPASVLMVGECDGFADKGGMVNFLPQQEKIRFEVNLTTTRAAHVQISSQVLRLASRVIDKQEPEAPAK
jgi:hypothetical protein